MNKSFLNRDAFYWQSDIRSADDYKKYWANRYENNEEDVSNVIKDLCSDLGVVTSVDFIKLGSVNFVSRVQIDGNKYDELVFRIHPKNVANGYFHSERLITDKFRVAGGNTFEVVKVGNYDNAYDYMIMSPIKGSVVADLGEPGEIKNEKEIRRKLGEQLAILHSIEVDGYGFLDNIKSADGAWEGLKKTNGEHYYAKLEENIEYLIEENVITKEESAKLRKFIPAADSEILNSTKPTIIHNDVAYWNMLWDGKKVSLADWDETVVSDPVMEFAALGLFYPQEFLDDVLEGYYEAGGKMDSYKEKIDIYTVRYLISKLKLRVGRRKVESGDWAIDIQKKIDHAKGILLGYLK